MLLFMLLNLLGRKFKGSGKDERPPQMSTCFRLPIELWYKIVTFLEKSALLSLSRTCHYMRAIAVPTLYSCLRVRVGYRRFPWEYRKPVKKAFPILRQLTKADHLVAIRCPLSSLVKTCVVIGDYKLRRKEKCGHYQCRISRLVLTQDKDLLTSALRRLENLDTLLWDGADYSPELSDAITARCFSLKMLRITGLDIGTLSH